MLVMQSRMNVHDLFLSYLFLPCLVFLALCFLDMLLLLLLFLSMLQVRERSDFLFAHRDRCIDASERILFSTDALQSLLACSSFIMCVNNWIRLFLIFLFTNVDKGEVCSLLNMFLVDLIHVSHCILVHKRFTRFSLGQLFEVNGRWFSDFGQDCRVTIDVFKPSVMSIRQIGWTVWLEMHLHIGKFDRDLACVW